MDMAKNSRINTVGAINLNEIATMMDGKIERIGMRKRMGFSEKGVYRR